MKVGLYFGTFNPIHVGHLIIANYMADYTDLDEVWMVVTPQNPLKKNDDLLEDSSRLELVQCAVNSNPKIKACAIEFELSKPSFTDVTLKHLHKKHPSIEFALIIGEDNLRRFHKWQNYKYLLENYQIYVYPRAITEAEAASLQKFDNKLGDHASVTFCEAPVLYISATFIRDALSKGKDVRYLLTEPVHEVVVSRQYYQN